MPKKRDRNGIYWRKDARKYWISYIDAKGNRQREPGAKSWEEARQRLEETRARVKEEASLKPGEMLACLDSFADVADRFLAYQKPRITSRAYQREAGIVAHLKAFFTGRLVDVTSSQVSDYVTARLGTVSKSSVRKELISLRHLFRLACSEWKLLQRFADPCLDVTAPKVRDERTQHLSPECRWKYVDGSRILLPTSKNDAPKEVHLNTFAQQVLASIPQGEPEARLFPDLTPEAVSMGFHRVCEELGISDIRLHDLRHTFATWLRQQGIELDVIASQLGHRDLRMTKRYARIASAQVRQAVNGLDSMLGAVSEAETGADSHKFVTATLGLSSASSVTH